MLRRFRPVALLVCLVAYALVGCSVYDPDLIQAGSGGAAGTGGTGGVSGTSGTGGTGGVCTPTNGGVEICDGMDNDCDGLRDDTDPEADVACRMVKPNATSRCTLSGTCILDTCDPGYADCAMQKRACEPCSECPSLCPADADAGDTDSGVEDAGNVSTDAGGDAAADAAVDASLPCMPTNGGAEACDGVDNDCNDMIDEGNACPTNCTGHTVSTGVYAVCRTAAVGGAARSNCGNSSRFPTVMHLVRIDSLEENMAIRQLVTQDINANAHVWIGGTDNDSGGLAVEGEWEWTNGDKFWTGGLNGMVVPGFYSNWAVGQPDDAASGEDCLEMWMDGTWNDNACSTTFAYVCEL